MDRKALGLAKVGDDFDLHLTKTMKKSRQILKRYAKMGGDVHWTLAQNDDGLAHLLLMVAYHLGVPEASRVWVG